MTDHMQAAPAVMAPLYRSRHPAQGRSPDPVADAGYLIGRGSVRTRRISALGFLVWVLAVFVVAFGLVWLYVAAMPMAFLNRDYPVWIAKRTMLGECRLGSVSVFGDSRTMAATLPGVMSVPVTNFALSGTSPIETYFMVERAIRCAQLPKLAVIAHSALEFTGDSDYWVFSAKMGFLSYAEMRAVESDAARLHDRSIEDLRRGDGIAAPIRDALFALRFPPFYFDSLLHGFIAARLRHNQNAMRDTLQSSGHALFGTDAGSNEHAGEADVSAFAPSPLVDLYFSRTLTLLAKHHVPVIVLTMPVNHATYLRVQPELRDRFSTYLQTKAKQYPGLHIVGPTLSCWPDTFFGDGWHFNGAGADAYSRELDPWLSHVLSGGTPHDLPDHCARAG
jgi:hypothetical protein